MQILPEPERTKILTGDNETTAAVLDFVANADQGWCTCGDRYLASVAIEVPEICRAIGNANARGTKLRYITDITLDNIQFCKQLAEMVELRHLEGVKANFSVSDKHYMAATMLVGGASPPQVIYSNVSTLVEQQQYTFDTLWSMAIDAEHRFNELEEGIEPERTELIADRHAIAQTYRKLVGGAARELKLLLPSMSALKREERIGVISLLEKAAKKGANVQVIISSDHGLDSVRDILQHLTTKGVHVQTISTFSPDGKRGVKSVIADNSRSLVIDLADDTKETFEEAVTNAILTTQKSLVTSYSRMFDGLWLEADAAQKLEEQDRLQREFVNIAAHELRTPIQPLLVLSDLLESEFAGDKDESRISRSDMEMIVRNVRRLERLSSDILQVSRIESRSLTLNREQFNLISKIRNVVNDMQTTIPKGSRLQIVFEPSSDVLIVNADETKVFEVVANILRNAIKFTESGRITISSRTSSDGHDAIVTIRDTGSGISPEILPKLFTKFIVSEVSSNNNRTGSGLGLFISRSFIEAHGGRIWAENNPEGKGATFGFTLPRK